MDCIITSPPYFKVRDYSDNKLEVGKEDSPDEFVQSLMRIFSAAKAALKPEGSLWINIADTVSDGIHLMVPEKLLLALHDAGWYIRNKVVWYKPDAQAESASQRFNRKYEFLYWFTKRKRGYYFEPDATKIEVKRSTVERFSNKFYEHKATEISAMRSQLGDQSHKIDEMLEKGVDCGDVWIVPVNKVKVNHPAPYPEGLILRAIVATCPRDGLVVDPFTGSGTTGVAAVKMLRRFQGCDLDPQWAAEATDRIQAEMVGGLFAT